MDVCEGHLEPQAEAEESSSGRSQAAMSAHVTRCNPEPGRGHPPTPAEATAWPQGDHNWVALWMLKDCSAERLPSALWTGGQPHSLGSNGHEQFPF